MKVISRFLKYNQKTINISDIATLSYGECQPKIKVNPFNPHFNKRLIEMNRRRYQVQIVMLEDAMKDGANKKDCLKKIEKIKNNIKNLYKKSS